MARKAPRQTIHNNTTAEDKVIDSAPARTPSLDALDAAVAAAQAAEVEAALAMLRDGKLTADDIAGYQPGRAAQILVIPDLLGNPDVIVEQPSESGPKPEIIAMKNYGGSLIGFGVVWEPEAGRIGLKSFYFKQQKKLRSARGTIVWAKNPPQGRPGDPGALSAGGEAGTNPAPSNAGSIAQEDVQGKRPISIVNDRLIYNGQDVGLAEILPQTRSDAGGNGIEIARLYIDKGHQKQGIGSALIGHLFDAYPEAGFIDVYPSGPSESYWIKRGGRRVGSDGYRRIMRPAKILEQRKDSRRGQISLGRRNAQGVRPITITLFQRADLSTFLHESGHLYLELLGDAAEVAKVG